MHVKRGSSTRTAWPSAGTPRSWTRRRTRASSTRVARVHYGLLQPEELARALAANPCMPKNRKHLAAQQVRLHLRVGDAARRRRDPQLDEEDDEPVGEERRELGAVPRLREQLREALGELERLRRDAAAHRVGDHVVQAAAEAKDDAGSC